MGRWGLLLFVLSIGGCALVANLDDLRGTNSSDAGNDAGNDGSASAFCSGTHLLCESFDNEDGGWSSSWTEQKQYATMAVVTDDFRSPPGSLRITSTAPAAHGVLLGTFATSALNFTCAVSLRITNFKNGYYVYVSPVILDDNGDPNFVDYEIVLRGYSGVGSFDELSDTLDADVENVQSPIGTVIDGQWHRLFITLHLSAPATAAIAIDDITTGKTRSITPPSAISGVSFAIGLPNAGTAGGDGGWTANFDNAVCDPP